MRSLLGSLAVLALEASLLAVGVGGFPRLLAHPRALALLATWLIAYPTLALLRPVRTHDPVTQRFDRPAFLTLFLIPTFTPLLSALGERMDWWLMPGGGWLRWGGVGLAAAGLALRIEAMRELGSRFSPIAAIQREHALETAGLYRRIRHPGYLGAWLCNLGIVLAFGSGITVPLLVAMGLAIASRVRKEEELLEERFGDAFRDYRAGVGGFLPRLGGGS